MIDFRLAFLTFAIVFSCGVVFILAMEAAGL